MTKARPRKPSAPTKPEPAPPRRVSWFRPFAEHTARALGSPWAFLAACTTVVVWALSGPAFHFSDTWQMVINTGTTIVTFLMVFLLQNTQTRDSQALHLKLDELLRAVHKARTGLVGLEQLPDDRLKQLAEEFTELGLHERGPDQECPLVDDAPPTKAASRRGPHRKDRDDDDD